MKLAFIFPALLLASVTMAADETSEQRLARVVYEAARITEYKIPDAPLTVITVKEKQILDAIVCSGHPKCGAWGVYQDMNVITLLAVEDWHEQDDKLFHEVVHYLQHHSGKFPHVLLSTCDEIYAREVEAYKAQNRFIVEVQKRSPHEQYSIPPNRCHE